MRVRPDLDPHADPDPDSLYWMVDILHSTFVRLYPKHVGSFLCVDVDDDFASVLVLTWGAWF